MAGIGFRLQKILDGDSYLSSIKAHFYSALISSGPWILSILTLFCLSYFSPGKLNLYEITLFRSILIYIFSFSLIVSGIFYFPMTRYLADKLYEKEEENVVPIFNSSLLSFLILQTVIGGIFFSFLGVGLIVGFLALMIYLTISAIWIIMVFLTALRDYKSIGWSYLGGSLLAVGLAYFLGDRWGLAGYLFGYWTGHLLIVVSWSLRIFIEFESRRMFDWNMIRFVMNNKSLILMGFFYNLAIWIDKFIFWLSKEAVSVAPIMKICPKYDSAAFFAYLTIIPALSIFLLHVETDFYKQYRRFYTRIMDKATYNRIMEAKSLINQALQSSLGFIIRYQGLISILCITFAPEICTFLRLPYAQIPIFRALTLGAFLHSLVLVVFIVMLYFDLKKLALGVSIVFLSSNALFTVLTIYMGPTFYGYGYLLSCFLTLIFAFYALDAKLKVLPFLTFALQPIGIHRDEEIV